MLDVDVGLGIAQVISSPTPLKRAGDADSNQVGESNSLGSPVGIRTTADEYGIQSGTLADWPFGGCWSLVAMMAMMHHQIACSKLSSGDFG